MEQQSMISTKIKFVDKEQVSKKKKVKLISKVEPFLYLTPAFAVFMVFVFYPFVKTIILSLSQTNLRGEIKSFVGLENFIELFQSPEFYSSIIVTFKFVFLVATPSVIIGFVLALLANNKLKGNRIYELMFSLPMAIASAPAAAIWTMIFHPTNGVLNFVLGQEIGWLTDPRYALISVAVVTTWLNLGLNFIF